MRRREFLNSKRYGRRIELGACEQRATAGANPAVPEPATFLQIILVPAIVTTWGRWGVAGFKTHRHVRLVNNEERFIDHGAAIVDKTGLNLAAEQVWRGLLGDCNVQPLMCVTLRWVIESIPICCGWVFWAFVDDALVRKID